MTLVGRHGPRAGAPVEDETRDDVDEHEQALEDEREARRRMFEGLGWSTSSSAAPAPVPAIVEHYEPGRIDPTVEVVDDGLEPYQRAPRCAGCSWAGQADPCPGRGGAACSRVYQLERLERMGLLRGGDVLELEQERAAAVEVERLEAVEERAAGIERYREERTRELEQERDRESVVLEVAGAPAAAGELEAPRNAVTGAFYGGKNIDRLTMAAAVAGYGPGGWAGFKQWLSVGRVVRKGEHGTACVTVIGKREGSSSSDAPADAPADASSSRKGKGGGVRGFRVFHFDQTVELVEGVE